MPELPEVTTVIGILNNELKNKTIINVDVIHKNIVQDDIATFKQTLCGKKILFITRLGKFIIFHLSDNTILISHLRMEGKYAIIGLKDKYPSHTCVVFTLDSKEKLVYHDTRKFGIMKLSDESRYLSEKPLSILGPEPMTITTDELKEEVFKKFNKNKPMKELLLDQSIMAGIGNIYADEILYACNINPLTFGSDLTRNDYENVIKNAIRILNRAIELGGSTIKSYHPKEGVNGLFQIELKAYGRVGQLCPKCGTKFHKIRVGGRGTTFCPNCQLYKPYKKAIGITGSIGSGKTTVLDIFKELGYKTYSCDKIVADLYTKEEAKKGLVKIFGYQILENEKINKQTMRKMIQDNDELHEKLEDFVFPLVENEIIKIIETVENPIIEVPMLYKAHIEYLFKSIIYVDATKELREKRLSETRSYNAKKAIELYEKNNKKTPDDAIILKNNYSTKRELKSYIKKEIINII